MNARLSAVPPPYLWSLVDAAVAPPCCPPCYSRILTPAHDSRLPPAPALLISPRLTLLFLFHLAHRPGALLSFQIVGVRLRAIITFHLPPFLQADSCPSLTVSTKWHVTHLIQFKGFLLKRGTFWPVASRLSPYEISSGCLLHCPLLDCRPGLFSRNYLRYDPPCPLVDPSFPLAANSVIVSPS